MGGEARGGWGGGRRVRAAFHAASCGTTRAGGRACAAHINLRNALVARQRGHDALARVARGRENDAAHRSQQDVEDRRLVEPRRPRELAVQARGDEEFAVVVLDLRVARLELLYPGLGDEGHARVALAEHNVLRALDGVVRGVGRDHVVRLQQRLRDADRRLRAALHGDRVAASEQPARLAQHVRRALEVVQRAAHGAVLEADLPQHRPQREVLRVEHQPVAEARDDAARDVENEVVIFVEPREQRLQRRDEARQQCARRLRVVRHGLRVDGARDEGQHRRWVARRDSRLHRGAAG